MGFTPFGGGLVDTIVAGAANTTTTGLTNQLTSNIQFSVGSVLGGAVQDASGYSLAAGNSWALSQISAALPPGENNALTNAIVTQVAQVGLTAVQSFAEQTVQNLLTGQPIFQGLGGIFGSNSNNPSGQGAGGFIGIHAKDLPDAEYFPQGGDKNLYTTQEVVFTIIPANTGPQSQAQAQTAWKIPLNTAFKPDFSNQIPGLQVLKGGASLLGPSSGGNISGRNAASYSGAKVDTNAFTGNASLKSSIPAFW